MFDMIIEHVARIKAITFKQQLKKVIVLVTLYFATFCPFSALATPISYNYLVDVYYSSGSLLQMGLNSGSQISGSFTIDSSPIYNMSDERRDWLGYSLTEAYVDLGASLQNLINPDAFGTGGFAMYQEKDGEKWSSFGFSTYPRYNGQSFSANLMLTGSDAIVFPDIFNLNPPKITDYTGSREKGGWYFDLSDLNTVNGLSYENGQLRGFVTDISMTSSPVPVPSSILLLGTGLLGLLGFTRTKRQ